MCPKRILWDLSSVVIQTFPIVLELQIGSYKTYYLMFASQVREIDFYHAAAVLHKHKTFWPSILAVKNLKTSIDGQKKTFVLLGLNMAAT